MPPPPEQIETQRAFWNAWNAASREQSLAQISLDQAEVVTAWLHALGRSDLDIIEVGCGAGWLCSGLTRFGRVTGTDLSDEVLARAAQRTPSARFVAGDFMQLDFPDGGYDVAISLEVLSHVADQRAFLDKIARLLKPGGYLMLATQNRPALERNDIAPPQPGQIRRWVDRHELRRLLEPGFELRELFSITPQFNRGPLRLVNSHKLGRLLHSTRLGALHRGMRRVQEKAWLGWTLMALARKRES